MKIALASYYDERQYVKDLPQVCDIPDLYGFARNGLGVVALENEKMIGFLCCCEPFDNAFRATDDQISIRIFPILILCQLRLLLLSIVVALR